MQIETERSASTWHTSLSCQRPLKRRQGKDVPCPSSNPARLTTSQFDVCIVEHACRQPFHPHPLLMKTRLRNMALCSRETRSPSVPVKVSRHLVHIHPPRFCLHRRQCQRRAHADYCQSSTCNFFLGKMGNYRKPHDGVHAQDYHTGPRPSSYCENGLILDDCNLEGDVCKGGNEFLDSGHLPGSSKASHSSGMEMLQNHTSIMLPCFEGLATTKYMLQVLKLREKKNKITKTAMYSNKPSNTSLDDHNGDDVSHGNVLYLEKRPRESRGYGQPHPASEDDELPKWQSPLSSVQASLFLHDGIFYQTPRRRPPVNVNAPRRLRKLESSKNPLAYARRVNNANRCQKRKAGFHTSSNFATLASYEKLELWDSPKDSAGCEVGNIMKLDNLAQFAVRESAGTTDGIKNCVQIAENINSMVANTLNILHQQGEQTREAHECTLEIDHNLSAGEKILGSFGRFFSTKTWKPVKMRVIKGPQKPSPRGSVLDKKCNSGLLDFAHTFVKSQPVRLHSGLPTEVKLPWQAKVKIEEREQIDGLTDLSNIVSELKKMSLNMGDELSRQTEALDPFQDEVVELSQRLKRANLRGRLLLA